VTSQNLEKLIFSRSGTEMYDVGLHTSQDSGH